MTVQLHDTGEEYILDVVMDGSETRATSITIGLFNDSTNALTDSEDLGDITTEPSGGSYARQTVNLNTTDINNTDASGDWQSAIANQLTFDTSDSTQTIDSYFAVINYQSDDKSDTAATDHLFWTGSLDQTYDLSQIDTFNIDADTAGIKIS